MALVERILFKILLSRINKKNRTIPINTDAASVMNEVNNFLPEHIQFTSKDKETIQYYITSTELDYHYIKYVVKDLFEYYDRGREIANIKYNKVGVRGLCYYYYIFPYIWKYEGRWIEDIVHGDTDKIRALLQDYYIAMLVL